jgi:hypothetical protein
LTFLVLAQAMTQNGIQRELENALEDEQFLQEEHLARPLLDKDNHPAAAHCLDLILAAKERLQLALREGGWQVRTLLAAKEISSLASAQGILHAAYADAESGRPEPLRWQTVADPRALTFLRGAELAALTRPPCVEVPGFVLTASVKGSTDNGRTALFGASSPKHASPVLALGRILADHGHPAHWLEMPVDDLCRHLLIAGMNGSGKSVACEHLLLSLWLEHRLPWLVIEPGMKPGYRRLLHTEMNRDLRVLAVGRPNTARLPLNPLHVPPGANLAGHCASLHALLASAFELVPPMPEVLATAIEQTYQKWGWDLHQVAPEGPAPNLADLLREVEWVIEAAGYGREITGNLRAGLLLRLQRLLRGPLAPEWSATGGLDAADLAAQPTIIELCAVPDATSQALVMGLIALQLRHHWQRLGPADSLRHVLVLEEAHRLLRQVADTEANATRIRAVEDLSDMLAELRGFGAGMVVVDQTPSFLAPSVLANTGSKLVMRLGHPTDRDVVGRSLGLPPDQVDLLGCLAPGEAVFHSDRAQRPFRLKMPNPALDYGSRPMPPIPIAIAPKSPPETAPLCASCLAADCHDARIGANPARRVERLHALQQHLAVSAESVRSWATEELASAGLRPNDPTQVACFLLALGRASGFSDSLLASLRQRFTSPSS